jgi:ADP-ribose pyrophosphatase
LSKIDSRPHKKRKLVFEGRRLTVYRDTVPICGKDRIRDWIARPKVSAMVVVTPKNKIVLVRQYRHGANAYLWEIPAGTVDQGELPRVCAKRETEEETGYKPKKLTSLGTFIVMPAESNGKVYLYIAIDLIKTKPNPDSDEELEIREFNQTEIKRMLKQGKISDAKSIIGLYRYFEKRS